MRVIVSFSDHDQRWRRHEAFQKWPNAVAEQHLGRSGCGSAFVRRSLRGLEARERFAALRKGPGSKVTFSGGLVRHVPMFTRLVQLPTSLVQLRHQTSEAEGSVRQAHAGVAV